ncbi:aldo/keto reductase [Halalkalibacter kiskunsagensis]|uniref:Aldo/keto reductase n=1 Tax=Halalkalibacter kiskunsagensis TaxID=1548599 RepID=A0ABV6KEE6_9BACI
MEKRKLGNSDLIVSVLGMGCWQYGGGSYWGEQNQRDVDLVVHKSLDLGINYFDTAEVYNDGESEKALGIAIKNKRNQAIIGTKFTPANATPVSLRQSCEQSLKRLQTDYIDLYMLHWPINHHAIRHFTDNEDSISNPPLSQEVFQTLEDLQKEGKIRYIGVSNHGVKQMKAVEEVNPSVMTNELAYNLFSRGIEHEILPYCTEKNIGVIGYMPLQQGLLTGKYSSLSDVKPMQARSRHFHFSRGEGSRHGENGAEQEIEIALAEIKAIADELNVHMIELSLAWAISNQEISSTIVGSRTERHLDLNVKGAYLKLPQDVMNRLNDITNPVLEKLGANPDYYESRYNSRIF